MTKITGNPSHPQGVGVVKKHSICAGVVEKNVPATAAQKKNLEKKSIWMVRCRAQTYVRPTRGRAVTHKHTHKQTNIPNRPCPLRLKLLVTSPTPLGAGGVVGVVKEHKFLLVLIKQHN